MPLVPSATCAFPLLADPANYIPCQWDLRDHDERRAYWVKHFRTQFASLIQEAVAVEIHDGVSEDDASERGESCAAALGAYLDSLMRDPHREGRLDILTICRRREALLREHAFADPYRLVKERENDAALLLLPQVLAGLDALPSPQREQAIIEGVFAGNIFDVGALATLAMFQAGTLSFLNTRDKLKPRPWRLDGLDTWLDRLKRRPHRAAVVFADNAGFDILLGILPFARSLLQRSTRVILAANTTPSLNDITAAELRDIVHRVSEWEPVLGNAWRSGQLQIIPSGCGTPLIDLAQVSVELVEAVEREGVDLVVLEGMGRAVESNLHIPFTRDAIKVALIKDLGVAAALGWAMYDQVFKFDQPA